MAHTTPGAAGRVRLGGTNPLDWSLVDRTLLGALTVFPWVLWFAAWQYAWLGAPSHMTFDRPAMRALLGVTLAFLASEAVVIAWGLRLRRRSPEHTVFPVLQACVFAIGIASASYFFGHYTTPLGTGVALSGAFFSALFLGRAATTAGVWCFAVIVIGTTIAEQAGLIPYAPSFTHLPVEAGRLATGFLILIGLPAFAAFAVGTVQVYWVLERRREREARLAEANSRLEDSLAELSCAYAELERAEVQLVQSEKLASLGRLAAGVAHEINNPVSSIASNIEPLRERLEEISGVLSPEAHEVLAEAREYVDIMGRGAQRVARIVADLRTFSRLHEAPPKEVDLREGIETSLRLLESRWRERIAIHRDFGDLPLVECDAGQMNQVFMNLLANACDAIEGSGNIWITARRSGNEAVAEVRDDGRAIPPDRLAQIFEPVLATSDQDAGHGLGLALVRESVTAHGGRLDVESAPGRGTTFRVTLPTNTGHRGDEPAERASSAPEGDE